MRETRNFFQTASHQGCFTIRSGVLTPGLPLRPEAWIAMTGADGVNGVYQLDAAGCLPLPDMAFTGTVWLLSPPAAFLALCRSIAAWCAVQPADSLRRESFGGYARELAADASGCPLTWQRRFARELTPYRRMYPGVNL